MRTSESSTIFTTPTLSLIPISMSLIDTKTIYNEELGLFEMTATLTLPAITVTRSKKDKSDFKYEIQRAFTDVVEQVIEGEF